MVQIKKKVTLKAKTEQESVVETQQQTTVQPTLRKKTPSTELKPEPQPVPAPDGNATGGNGGKNKVVGGLVALAVVGLLGYGAYSLLTHSDDKNSDTTTEQVEGAAPSNEGDTKDVPNEETAGTPDAENANDENTTVPSQDEPSSEAAIPQSESTQDASVKPAEPTKQSTQSNEIAKQTVTTSQSVALPGTLEEKAKDVIRGNYGNGVVRKQKLGDQYDEIQSKVNEMYRNGLVK